METERVKVLKSEVTKLSDDDEHHQCEEFIKINDDNCNENTKLLQDKKVEDSRVFNSTDRLSINGDCSVCTNKIENNQRKRSDEPAELCFEKCN